MSLRMHNVNCYGIGNEYFEGLNEFFKMLEANQYKIQYRVMLARYRGKTTCPDCRGSRLKKEASYVKVGDKSLELVLLTGDKTQRIFLIHWNSANRINQFQND